MTGPTASVGAGTGRPPSLALPAEVGRAIRVARLSRGMTTEELAAACRVSVPAVVHLEAGSPAVAEEPELVEAFKRIVDYLWMPEGEPATLVVPVAPPAPAPAPAVPAVTDTPTAQLPSVEPPAPVPAPRRAPTRALHGLRLAFWVTAAALVVALVVLGAVWAGVLGPSHPQSATPPTSSGGQPAPSPAGNQLLRQSSSGSNSATYTVGATRYRLTISAQRPSWIQVGPPGGTPVFAATVQPGSTHQLSLSGTVEVEVGAGGTTLRFSGGHHTATLSPSSAPFTYTLQTG